MGKHVSMEVDFVSENKPTVITSDAAGLRDGGLYD